MHTSFVVVRLAAFLAIAIALPGAGCGDDDAPATPTDLGLLDASRDAAPTPTDAGAPDLTGCADEDRDGHAAAACGGDDCDDADPNRHPSATEICDTDDEDCNDSTFGADADGDSFESSACCNGPGNCGPDCDDRFVTVNPLAVEACNGVDENCNGMIDDGLTRAPYRQDCDGDAYGDSTIAPLMLCGAPDAPPACPGGGWVPVGGDCDDGNPNTHPGAPEICNHADDNCNATNDEGLMIYAYRVDCDADGHGSSTAPIVRDCNTPPPPVGCPLGTWTLVDATDCCDTDPLAYPGQASFFATANACGSFDYNCDANSEQIETRTVVCTPPPGGGPPVFVSAGWGPTGVPACGASADFLTSCSSAVRQTQRCR